MSDNTQYSDFYPSKSKGVFNPLQKQRGYILSGENAGPLDTAEWMLTFPDTIDRIPNLYPGKLFYVFDRDQYYFYNTEGFIEKVSDSGMDINTQAWLEIDFDVSYNGSIINKNDTSLYNSYSRTWILQDEMIFTIIPSVYIRFKGEDIKVNFQNIDVSIDNAIGLPQNTMANTIALHNGISLVSDNTFKVFNTTDFMKAGNIIYHANIQNENIDISAGNLRITSRFHYIIDTSSSQYNYNTVFRNNNIAFSDYSSSLLYMKENSSMLQKGFIISSASGGAFDVGKFISPSISDVSNLSQFNNLFPGKSVYSYADDQWYYLSYCGAGNFEVNFPDFSKQGTERIKTLKNRNLPLLYYTCQFIPFVQNNNSFGLLSRFQITVSPSAPLSAHLDSNNTDNWLLSYDGFGKPESTGYNQRNASGIIQPTGPDKFLPLQRNMQSSNYGGIYYASDTSNMLDQKLTLSAHLSSILNIGGNIFDVPIVLDSSWWKWTVDSSTVFDSSIDVNFSNYEFTETDPSISVELLARPDYYSDNLKKYIVTKVKPYYRQSELHVAPSLYGLVSNWNQTNNISINGTRYSDDTVNLYCNITSVNKSWNRSDINDTYYLLLADASTETGFSAVPSENWVAVDSLTYTDPRYGQYHTMSVPSYYKPDTSVYHISVTSHFNFPSTQDIYGNWLSSAFDTRIFQINLNEYDAQYSIQIYSDSATTNPISILNFDAATDYSNKNIFARLLDSDIQLKDKGRDSSITWDISYGIKSNPNASASTNQITDASAYNDISVFMQTDSLKPSWISVSVNFSNMNSADETIMKSGNAENIDYFCTLTATDNYEGTSAVSYTFDIMLSAVAYQLQFRINDGSWYEHTAFMNQYNHLKQYPLSDTIIGQNSFTLSSRIVHIDPSNGTSTQIMSGVTGYNLSVWKDGNVYSNNYVNTGNEVLDIDASRGIMQKADTYKQLGFLANATIADASGNHDVSAMAFAGFDPYIPLVKMNWNGGFQSFLTSNVIETSKTGNINAMLYDENDSSVLENEFTDGYKIKYIWNVDSSSALDASGNPLLVINNVTDTSTVSVTVKPNISDSEKTIQLDCTANVYRYSLTSGTLPYSSTFPLAYTIGMADRVNSVSNVSSSTDIFTNGISQVQVKVTVSGNYLTGNNIFSSTGLFVLQDSLTTVNSTLTSATYTFRYMPSVSDTQTITVNPMFTSGKAVSIDFNVYVLKIISVSIDSPYSNTAGSMKRIVSNTDNYALLKIGYVTDSSGDTSYFTDVNKLSSAISSVNKPYSDSATVQSGSYTWQQSLGAAYSFTCQDASTLKIGGISSDNYSRIFTFIASLNTVNMTSTANNTAFTTPTVTFVKPSLWITSPSGTILYTESSYTFQCHVFENTAADTSTDITSDITGTGFTWSGIPQQSSLTFTGSSLTGIKFSAPASFTALMTSMVYTGGNGYSLTASALYNISYVATIINSPQYSIRSNNSVVSAYNTTNTPYVSYNDVEYTSDMIETDVSVHFNAPVSDIGDLTQTLKIGINGSTFFTPGIGNQWTGDSDASYMFTTGISSIGGTSDYLYSVLIRPSYHKNPYSFEIKVFNNIDASVIIPENLKALGSSTQRINLPYWDDANFTDNVSVSMTNISQDNLTGNTNQCNFGYVFGSYSTSTGSITSISGVSIAGVTSSVSGNSGIMAFNFAKSHNAITDAINEFNGNFGLQINLLNRRGEIQSSTFSYSTYSIIFHASNNSTWQGNSLEFDKIIR